jgi:hypothetical protein
VTLLDLAAAAPDPAALDDLTRRRTRGELVDRATRAGRLLRGAGVAPGGAVALLLGNPRHPTGKLYTRLLRDRYWQGRKRRV